MLSVLPVDDFARWDAFVRAHPQGTLFHTTRWLRGWGMPEVRVLEDKQGIVAGAALIRQKRYLVPGYHVVPFTPYLHPLVRPSQKKGRSSIASDEQKALDEYLDQLPIPGHVDIMLPEGNHDLMPYLKRGYQVSVHYTHYLDTERETLLSNMSKTNRNYLRRLMVMEEAGEIKLENGQNFQEARPLLEYVMNRKGFNVSLDRLHRVLERFIPDNWSILSIRDQDDTLLSSLLYLQDWHALYYIASGTIRTKGVLNNSSLLGFLKMAEIAREQNLVVDLEGSVLPGVEEFYRRLGGRKVPLFRVQRSSSLVYLVLRWAQQARRELLNKHSVAGG